MTKNKAYVEGCMVQEVACMMNSVIVGACDTFGFLKRGLRMWVFGVLHYLHVNKQSPRKVYLE